MKKYIEDRAVEIANYIIESNATVRQAAKKFGISKSTVHKDMVLRLKEINLDLYYKVKDILQTNLQERHIRGGEATKKKYSKI